MHCFKDRTLARLFHTFDNPLVTNDPQSGFTSADVTLDIECAIILRLNWYHT